MNENLDLIDVRNHVYHMRHSLDHVRDMVNIELRALNEQIEILLFTLDVLVKEGKEDNETLLCKGP